VRMGRGEREGKRKREGVEVGSEEDSGGRGKGSRRQTRRDQQRVFLLNLYISSASEGKIRLIALVSRERCIHLQERKEEGVVQKGQPLQSSSTPPLLPSSAPSLSHPPHPPSLNSETHHPISIPSHPKSIVKSCPPLFLLLPIHPSIHPSSPPSHPLPGRRRSSSSSSFRLELFHYSLYAPKQKKPYR